MGLAGFAELFLKRKLSLPVSRMWQWWVSRSSSAVVILASPKTLGPLAEAQVGGDDDAGALVELAEQVEQQGAARGAERQVAELVEDHEIGVEQAIGDLPGLVLALLLLERVDQVDRGEEPDLLAVMLDGLDAEGRGEVGLAGAGPADQHDVVGVVQELAPVQLPDRGLVDLAGGEVEAGQVLVGREAGRLDLVGDRATSRSAISALSSWDRMGMAASKAGAPCSTRSPTAWAMPYILSAAQHDDEGGAGGIMTHGAPPGPRSAS